MMLHKAACHRIQYGSEVDRLMPAKEVPGPLSRSAWLAKKCKWILIIPTTTDQNSKNKHDNIDECVLWRTPWPFAIYYIFIAIGQRHASHSYMIDFVSKWESFVDVLVAKMRFLRAYAATKINFRSSIYTIVRCFASQPRRLPETCRVSES